MVTVTIPTLRYNNEKIVHITRAEYERMAQEWLMSHLGGTIFKIDDEFVSYYYIDDHFLYVMPRAMFDKIRSIKNSLDGWTSSHSPHDPDAEVTRYIFTD